MKTTTREQDAVRILMLLKYAHDDDVAQPSPPSAVACISGELRLQAMDFWLRNPDYLAEELLNRADIQSAEHVLHVAQARQIVLDEEPDLRTYPMLRYRHGAWERLDDSLSLLRTYGLATDIRRGTAMEGRRDFYLLERGDEVASSLLNEVPEVDWYRDRAILVRQVAGNSGGTELKQRQKQQFEYLSTAWNNPIPSIRERVIQRIEKLEAAQ